jgi:hypothetical protein
MTENDEFYFQSAIHSAGNSHSIQKQGQDLAFFESRFSEPDRKTLTDGQWASFWKMLTSIGIWEYEPEYMDPNTLDGHSWNLCATNGGSTVTSRGFNASPEQFHKLLGTLRSYFPSEIEIGRF